ncbi:hypothetical protein [Aeromicrobium sp. 179-A 4D2 NHS]|uniref:hypothetical protein n=1 Tax=Aeromicrobium sp. 179-A 4D2 NHS TaxID=3142375 RepID=UPI0039A168CA
MTDRQAPTGESMCDPIFEASYPYQSYFGTRYHRLGLFDNPDLAYQCLLEEGHRTDGEIHAIAYVFGAGSSGSRMVFEQKDKVYGARVNPTTDETDHGWLDLRDVSADPDYLRLLQLRDQFSKFLMWRQHHERQKSYHASRMPSIEPFARFYEARGEADPVEGRGGSKSYGGFETPEQAIAAAQGTGLGGCPGFVVMVELIEHRGEVLEARTGLWGQRKRLDGPGYEFGYSDYRDFYDRDDWREFTTLSEQFAGR